MEGMLRNDAEATRRDGKFGTLCILPVASGWMHGTGRDHVTLSKSMCSCLNNGVAHAQEAKRAA
eukprot:SAG31_NODE_46340_length_255_cov_0.589744_1_plen_64_part_01